MDDLTSNRILQLLSIEPEARSNEHVTELTDLMLRTELFESISNQIDMQAAVESCARKMKLKRYTPRHVVFRAGDEGKEFYFIVKGQVSLSVPYALLLANANKKRPSVVLTGMAQSVLTKSLIAKAMAEYQTSRDANGLFEVISLGPGFSFGDLALTKSAPRMLTVTVTHDAMLAYLSKSEFNRIMRKVQDRLFHEKVAFLGSLLPFKRLTGKGLFRLAHCFHYKSYRKHEVVYTEGEPTDSVFIIASGEFEFSKTLKSETERGLKTSMRRSIKRRKVLRLFSRSPKEFFGQEDLYETRNRFATCTCTSAKGEVYYIDKTDFTSHIMQGTANSTLRSQHDQLESFQNDLLEKSEHFEELLRSYKTDDPQILPSIAANKTINKSLSPQSRNLTPTRVEDKLFSIREKFQINRRSTIRKTANSNENSQIHSESPLKQSATETSIRLLKSARGSVMKQRPEETTRLQNSISEVRKELVKTALKPPKDHPSLANLKHRTFLRMKLESLDRDANIKKILKKQWE
mmetsp:Transcript_31380/g.54447  ORF Transcript_31380/g.54447 Transcript_31380/m.54447 type:complete len:519 (+) Transcript_31380:14-1570(+)